MTEAMRMIPIKTIKKWSNVLTEKVLTDGWYRYNNKEKIREVIDEINDASKNRKKE